MEISNMAAIFANTSLTIIASQGSNAEFRLRGLWGLSQPRHCFQSMFNIAKGPRSYSAGGRGGSRLPPRGLTEVGYSKSSLSLNDGLSSTTVLYAGNAKELAGMRTLSKPMIWSMRRGTSRNCNGCFRPTFPIQGD
jgi:hypothetical protein